MAVAAIIFDLDGTLLDSIADLSDSVNAVLAQHGYPPRGLASYRSFLGNGLLELVRRALPREGRDSKQVSRMVAAVRAEYGRRWHCQTRPFPGVPEMLSAVAGCGVRMGVLSNKPDEWTQLMVAHFFGNHRLDRVWGARESWPRKPDPAVAVAMANEWGLSVDQCAVVGDSEVDLETGRRAGMTSYGVLWGYRSIGQLTRGPAAQLFSSPAELAAAVRAGEKAS